MRQAHGWTVRSVGSTAFALILAFSHPVRAADPIVSVDAVAEPGTGSVTRAFDHYVVKGGWITWAALIPLSVTALALTVAYAITIRRGSVSPPETVERLSDLFERRAYPDALRFASEDRSVLAFVVYSGLVEARNGFAAMERAMEEAIDEQAARLARRIEYLNLIGNVAPMIGLFGTVTGIIGMFVSISEAGGIPVMSRISDDLGTALVATFWGLLVAIPSLSAFGLFRNRIDVLLAECALTADRLTAMLRPQPAEGGKAPGAGAPPAALASATV